MIFNHLRKTPWEPTFTWVATVEEAADQINSFHEDYPKRVPKTMKAIGDLCDMMDNVVLLYPGSVKGGIISTYLFLAIHTQVFDDTPFAGRPRDVQVRVGGPRPPPSFEVPRLMAKLQDAYTAVTTLETLKEWYWDFETIHPFQDGNGRVGGIMVAAYSHAFEPSQGWLAPNQ